VPVCGSAEEEKTLYSLIGEEIAELPMSKAARRRADQLSA
jgi:hypothetical protein